MKWILSELPTNQPEGILVSNNAALILLWLLTTNMAEFQCSYWPRGIMQVSKTQIHVYFTTLNLPSCVNSKLSLS